LGIGDWGLGIGQSPIPINHSYNLENIKLIRMNNNISYNLFIIQIILIILYLQMKNKFSLKYAKLIILFISLLIRLSYCQEILKQAGKYIL